MTGFKNGQLRAWHFPYNRVKEVGEAKPFEVLVSSLEEAANTLRMLEQYDIHAMRESEDEVALQCNCVCRGLETYILGEWVEWQTEEFEDFNQYLASQEEAIAS